jgi:hypothetical protein
MDNTVWQQNYEGQAPHFTTFRVFGFTLQTVKKQITNETYAHYSRCRKYIVYCLHLGAGAHGSLVVKALG